MTRNIEDLYQRVVLEHCKRPRNYRTPPDASHRACGDNPLCGDHIDVYLRLEHGAILDIAFTGVGCALAKASASMMTEALMGRDTARGYSLLGKFEQMINSAAVVPDPELGDLCALSDVRDFPSRVQCAMLAWDALRIVLHADRL
ncbi:MAG: Fe-S cluster assembly sulfur transfer protein SufU [Steroidobacteraceae bacterium]|jgi:nitrogen fixation NifU-like protein